MAQRFEQVDYPSSGVTFLLPGSRQKYPSYIEKIGCHFDIENTSLI